MGFLNAVYDLGKIEVSDVLNDQENMESNDIAHLFKLPLSPESKGKEIRIHLNVDKLDKPLDVKGISKIDIVDFMAGEQDINKWERKYIYKDPIGANVSWKFTPILKMGIPKKDNRDDFLGHKKDNIIKKWPEDNKTYLFKIKNKLLMDYESSGYFTPGSVDRIMKALEEDIRKQDSRIINSFTERAKYIMVFGIDDSDDHFLYPGEIPVFVDYFKAKLNKNIMGKKSSSQKRCAMCGKEVESTVNLDGEIFKFATFDKKNFLPALDKNFHSKVFPICQECRDIFLSGRKRIDRECIDNRTLPGTRIWCVPELIGTNSNENNLNSIVNQFRNFIQEGGEQIERNIFDSLVEFENENLVFHFVFWEAKYARELVNMMIEDVPPTHLKKIAQNWEKSLKNILTETEYNGKTKLSWAIKKVYFTLIDLERENVTENEVMKDFAINIIGKILNGEKVNVESIKSVFVEKFPKLLHDNQSNSDSKIKDKIRDMFLIVDFISRLNEEVV